jgi:hypothetical protein
MRERNFLMSPAHQMRARYGARGAAPDLRQGDKPDCLPQGRLTSIKRRGRSPTSLRASEG